MNKANLTRFGPKLFELGPGKPTTYSAPFNAIDGPGKLVLRPDGIDNVQDQRQRRQGCRAAGSSRGKVRLSCR